LLNEHTCVMITDKTVGYTDKERSINVTGEQRRQAIIDILSKTDKPLNGSELAKSLDVSRQVIVTDIALIRANGRVITSTNRGYIINESVGYTRVFKVIHSDEDVETEMNSIVDLGGCIEDVFIFHKVYGRVTAPMMVKNRRDVKKYMASIKEGKSSYLKNVASGYHYHTVSADSIEALDEIMEELKNLGFLAALTDYEPVDFWNKE